jgi:ERF superfamily
MSRPKIPIPLVDKIAQAFEAVGKLPRAGTNRTRHYKYPRATDVFEAVRAHLFKRGILMCPTEGTPEYVTIGPSNGGEQITECRLQVTYTVRDALEKLEPMVVNGVGRDVEDKALYKAQTGAQKALLKRFGLIAEETDDPEWDGQQAPAGETIDDAAPMRTPRKEQPLAAYQIDAVREALGSTGKTDSELSEVVAARFHAPELADVKRKHFKELLKWASDGRGTIAAVPKPQAAPDQGALPLRAAPEPIQLKIGSKTVEFQPKDKAFAL